MRMAYYIVCVRMAPHDYVATSIVHGHWQCRRGPLPAVAGTTRSVRVCGDSELVKRCCLNLKDAFVHVAATATGLLTLPAHGAHYITHSHCSLVPVGRPTAWVDRWACWYVVTTRREVASAAAAIGTAHSDSSVRPSAVACTSCTRERDRQRGARGDSRCSYETPPSAVAADCWMCPSSRTTTPPTGSTCRCEHGVRSRYIAIARALAHNTRRQRTLGSGACGSLASAAQARVRLWAGTARASFRHRGHPLARMSATQLPTVP